MKLTRRQLLKASLGLGQVALLQKLGVPVLSRRARAAEPGSGPSRLLTIYVPGGWVPFYLWTPFTPAEIAAYIPPPEIATSEPCFFTADDVTNLDGSGDELDPSGYQKLRGPELWDEAALSAGQADPRSGKATSPHGWAWKHYQLWENASVVHGVDMMTAAHESARVSMLSGKASATFQLPAMHAWTAWATSEIYADRPLPSVAVGNGPNPNPASLGAAGAPTLMPTLGALSNLLSESGDRAWSGLRNRAAHPSFDYWGNPVSPDLQSNDMEEMVLKRTRGLAGTTNSTTDAFYERLYEGYKKVSSLLAQDLVTEISNAPGLVDEAVLPHPYWVPSNWSFFGSDIGGGVQSDSQFGVNGDMELAMKLLRSGLTTAVSVELRGVGQFYFDTHDSGHTIQFAYVRAVYDVIGRVLAQLKHVDMGGGKTLLDDTLVVVMSEFGRTWPMSGSCDHWPGNSVLFAGGGIAPNRQIGRYAVPDPPQPGLLGFMGDPVDVVEEGGTVKQKTLTSADIVYTTLHHMGALEQPGKPVSITGGVARIAGLEQG